MAEAELEGIESSYEVISTTIANGQITLRGIATHDGLPANAEVVQEPSLEESYMAYMAARGRSSAASQEEEHEVEVTEEQE